MAFYRPAPYQKPLAIGLLLAASSLNLVLGFGGMFSLGHAAFFGAGAYVAAICMNYGINDALLAFPLAMLAAGLLALLVGALSLSSDNALFFTALSALTAAIVFLGRLADVRFGRTIQAIRYRLACFALGGALAGLASPNLLQWMQSGTLLVMVIIGGVGYLYGGVVGAVVLLCLEEVLSGFTLHWHIGLGFLLLGIVLFAPKGVAALFGKSDD